MTYDGLTCSFPFFSRIGGGGACRAAVSYFYGKYFNEENRKAKGVNNLTLRTEPDSTPPLLPYNYIVRFLTEFRTRIFPGGESRGDLQTLGDV